jgi:hypothetical protein
VSERSERVATRFLQAKTYAKAKDDIMAYLDKKGWKVQKGLKVPHATSPDGDLRLWFKGQSIHTSEGNNHSLGSARSYTGYDPRRSMRGSRRTTHESTLAKSKRRRRTMGVVVKADLARTSSSRLGTAWYPTRIPAAASNTRR